MTPIADMVAQMLAAGVPHEAIILAVRTAEITSACAPNRVENRVENRVDETAEKRRAWDREYRKRRKDAQVDSTRIPPESTRNEKVSLIEEEKIEGSFNSKKETPKRKRGPIPPDWKPNERASQIAAELNLSVPPIEERFREYLASHGKLYADYDAAFYTFIRNTPRFNGGQNGLASANRSNSSSHERDRNPLVAAMASELAKRPGSRLYAQSEDPGFFGSDDQTTGDDRRPPIRLASG